MTTHADTPETESDDTDVLSAIAVDPPTDPSQTPAAPPQSSHRSAGAGQPDPDHGGTGMILMASGLAVAHPRTHDHPIRAVRRCSPEA